MEEQDMLDIQALMKKLHISRSTVFRLMRTKGLPSVHISARILRFQRDEIERWLEQQQKSA